MGRERKWHKVIPNMLSISIRFLASPRFPPRGSLAVLLGIVAAFLILRLPLMYRQPAGHDEEWCAVPGLMVAREGVPRIPYMPSRSIASAAYRVDEALLLLPPAYFYWQAPFYWALPAGCGTGRLASATAGLIALLLVYQLGRSLFASEAVGLWAAGLFSISRLFFFPATCARPDMLCATIGLGALCATWQWDRGGGWRPLVVSGILLGLGMLTHPFANVFSIQVALWVAIAAGDWRRRVRGLGLLLSSALAALALWLPLIVAYPDLFRTQFFNNILDRPGRWLPLRMLLPKVSIAYHCGMLWQYVQPLQLLFIASGVAIGTILAVRSRRRGALVAAALAWSGCYLMATSVGPYTSERYWCYPAALAFLCVATVIVKGGAWLARWCPRPLLFQVAAGAMVVGVLLPGSGVRAWAAHLRHWSDPNYDSSRFVQAVLRDLPPDAHLMVDTAFVFDVYLAGRATIMLAGEDYGAPTPYDYLIVGPVGRQHGLAAAKNARFLRAYGDPNDEFACFAQVYRPPPSEEEEKERALKNSFQVTERD